MKIAAFFFFYERCHLECGNLLYVIFDLLANAWISTCSLNNAWSEEAAGDKGVSSARVSVCGAIASLDDALALFPQGNNPALYVPSARVLLADA